MQRRPFLRSRRMAPRVCLSSMLTTSQVVRIRRHSCEPVPDAPECKRKTKRRHIAVSIAFRNINLGILRIVQEESKA